VFVKAIFIWSMWHPIKVALIGLRRICGLSHGQSPTVR
jgi:hypothetical protein